MNRAELLKHLRPLVENVVEEMAELLWSELELRISGALEAARSSLASDLSISDVAVDEPSTGVTRVRAVPPPPTARPVPARATAPKVTADRAAHAPTTGWKCSKCGLTGHNARRCNREPSLTKPATPVAVPPTRRATPAPASSPSSSKPDRFAQIEEAARLRAAKARREEPPEEREHRVDDVEAFSTVGLSTTTFATD